MSVSHLTWIWMSVLNSPDSCIFLWQQRGNALSTPTTHRRGPGSPLCQHIRGLASIEGALLSSQSLMMRVGAAAFCRAAGTCSAPLG